MGRISRKKINQDFFKIWSPQMSYILGYIAADGCIYKRKNRKNSYTLNITSKDKDNLLKMGKNLSPDCSISIKYNSQRLPYSQIQISNREICGDLISLGILPRKTYNLNFIKVPEEYFSDFVRGFFDGDGTVYIYKVNGTPQIKAGFVSPNLSFITEFNKQLCKAIDIQCKAVHKFHSKNKKVPLYNICFYIDDCERLYKFMYKNASIFLNRKHRVFKKWENVKLKNRRYYIKQNYPSKVGWHLNQKVLV